MTSPIDGSATPARGAVGASVAVIVSPSIAVGPWLLRAWRLTRCRSASSPDTALLP